MNYDEYSNGEVVTPDMMRNLFHGGRLVVPTAAALPDLTSNAIGHRQIAIANDTGIEYEAIKDGSTNAWRPLDTGWVTITAFSNGFSAASTKPAYRVIRNVLYLSGQLWRSTPPNLETAFTLPSGHAPRGNAQAPTVLDWSQVVQINTGGQVQIKASVARPDATGYILDGISFPIG